MASVSTVPSPPPPIVQPAVEVVEPGSAPAPGPGNRAITTLGSWMIALGIIRVGWALVDFVGAAWNAWRSGDLAALGWAAFCVEHQPAGVLVGVWLLLLGLALRRTRWPELVKASALTLLGLSVGGMLTAMADWGYGTIRGIAIGSFEVPRAGWSRLGTTEMAAVLAGSAQWLIELVTAVCAIRLALRLPERVDTGDDRGVAARRSWLGWLAVCLSIAVLAPTIRLPSGSVALDLINRSRWIRELILRDDLARRRGRRAATQRQSPWAHDVHRLLSEGQQTWNDGQYAAAHDTYARIVAQLDMIPTASMTMADRGVAARALNDSAWLLATCPEAALRDPGEAVRQSRRSLELAPQFGSAWTTLGVAYFRLGDCDEAQSALYRSMELRDEGDATEWFFLAMIHWRMGRHERAREWFTKAARWTRMHPRHDAELYRIEVEAAAALGLPKPDPQVVPRAPAFPPMTPPFHSRPIRGRIGPPVADGVPRPR